MTTPQSPHVRLDVANQIIEDLRNSETYLFDFVDAVVSDWSDEHIQQYLTANPLRNPTPTLSDATRKAHRVHQLGTREALAQGNEILRRERNYALPAVLPLSEDDMEGDTADG